MIIKIICDAIFIFVGAADISYINIRMGSLTASRNLFKVCPQTNKETDKYVPNSIKP